jgi:hypothetical protein
MISQLTRPNPRHNAQCHNAQGRGYLTQAILAAMLVLMLLLSACGTLGLALPGAEPTAQVVAVATTGPSFNPTITLDPPSGHAGIYVQVAGTGWPPNMLVVVILTDPSGISTTVATKDTDRAGFLSTGFLYPIDARWLLDAAYTISAESVDGKYRATAQFAVVEPGTIVTPPPLATPLATAVVAAPPTQVAPTAVAQVAAATFTPQPTAVPPTPVPPTPVPATPVPVQAQAAVAAGNNAPVVTAALIQDGKRSNSRQRFRVEFSAADADNNLRDVVAILVIPPFVQVDDVELDVKLKEKDKVEIKVERSKLEISAPDPEALLATIEQYGGIPVISGQKIEYREYPAHRFRLEVDDDTLEIRAHDLLLQVTAVDGAGLSHQVTVTPTALSDDDDNDDDDRPGNQGRGNGNNDDKKDDDKKDDDKNDNNKNDDRNDNDDRDNDDDDD